MVILGIVGISANALKRHYYSNLPSDILIKQEVSGTWIKPSEEYVYYKVNVKHGIIKSIDVNEYTEKSSDHDQAVKNSLDEAQQLLKSAGYEVNCPVVLDNCIYFSADNGNNGQSYYKYDKSTASIDKNFTPQPCLKGESNNVLMEMAAIDKYPELKDCIQKHETQQIEYGEIIISNEKVFVCMFDNSEKYSAKWLLYEYNPTFKELTLLCETKPYRIADIVFL
ncbi:MAG: hypothetical protein ACI4EN_08035 [Butyrivibrio sp.]